MTLAISTIDQDSIEGFISAFSHGVRPEEYYMVGPSGPSHNLNPSLQNHRKLTECTYALQYGSLL